MMIRVAVEADFEGLLQLAGQVEKWFGPMVKEEGFHEALRTHLRRGTALVALTTEPDPFTAGRPENGPVLGGLLYDDRGPVHHVDWLVVSQEARVGGVGRALMTAATQRFAQEPVTVEVITFGADHPGAARSGARVFYECLGFTPAERTSPGPEGGSRQVYRREAV
ncbi:GNAT family N-acetyltransferase [[Kitasatospora] papulosa]|uniref:GNAT family N-acetyltransferase n=1 Tax=[Kitasatospora] papulosa TaxID=1464011 RepID=UPI0036AE9034